MDFADAPTLVLPLAGEAILAGRRVLPGECALAESPSRIGLGAGDRAILVQPARPAAGK